MSVREICIYAKNVSTKIQAWGIFVFHKNFREVTHSLDRYTLTKTVFNAAFFADTSGICRLNLMLFLPHSEY